MAKPEPLPTASATTVVTERDLASALSPGADEFPAVYATSRMIALMEIAAARCLQPLLEDGELSVGVAIDALHAAATPLGGTVTAEARYAGLNGKRHRFEVVVRDDAGEVGRGLHERAIVRVQRLLEGAGRRLPASPKG